MFGIKSTSKPHARKPTTPLTRHFMGKPPSTPVYRAPTAATAPPPTRSVVTFCHLPSAFCVSAAPRRSVHFVVLRSVPVITIGFARAAENAP
jgi:hypothetical protein